MELCIGTVQFGMDYGINGKKKPPIEESIRCLDFAVNNGIKSIDTAAAYGNAEEIVGAYLRKKTINREKLWISSKLLPNVLDDCSPDQYYDVIRNELFNSLATLGTDYLDAFYFHSSRYAFNEEMLEAIHKIQREGFAKKVGVSVYEIEEAEACINSDKVTILQAPYSVFDHRMRKANIFTNAHKRNLEINIRSTFLQGLVLKDKEDVPTNLHEAKELTDIFKLISSECGIDRINLALAYVKREKSITKLVFGVHSIEQLRTNIEAFNAEIPEDVLVEIDKRFEEVPKQIVIPSLWKKD